MGAYFIRQNGRSVQGPFDEDRIRGWIAQGRVRTEMEFSADGQLWIPGSEHRLFAEGGDVVAPIEGTSAADGSLTNPLFAPWSPRALPSGTRIKYSGDRSNGFGMWSLELHADPPWNVHLDGWGATLVLRHIRSNWGDFFDVFALGIGGQPGIVGDGEVSMGFRVGESVNWETALSPTQFESAEEGLVTGTRLFVASPDRILALATPDQKVSLRVEVGGRTLETKLRLARVRSSVRAFTEYFRIEELQALWRRADAEGLSDEDLKAAKQILCAHTLG